MADQVDLPFWQTKRLEDMSRDEWESLCDGCGRCCLHKLEDDETGAIAFTNVACHLLDLGTCQCGNYTERAQIVPDCIALTPEALRKIRWLPPSCAYRIIDEGGDLPDWHPLITGDADSTRKAGIAVAGRVISETIAGPLEDHIVAWPGQRQQPRTGRRRR